MTKIIRKLSSILAMVIVLVSFSLSVSASDLPRNLVVYSLENGETLYIEDGSVKNDPRLRRDEIEYVYKVTDGVLYKRLWNFTRGRWASSFWVRV